MSDVINAIDKAIQAAQARKAARFGSSSDQPQDRPIIDKAAQVAQREQQRAEKKATREAVRVAKRLEKDANRVPHMRKVEKAAAKLPTLDESATLILNEITTNFSAAQVAAIAAHLQHFNRVKATERALSQPLTVGSKVRVIAGDQRFIGLEGEVTKSQRIRCYVSVPGRDKPIYLFTSDVEAVVNEPHFKAVNG